MAVYKIDSHGRVRRYQRDEQLEAVVEEMMIRRTNERLGFERVETRQANPAYL